jgi:hypothetical protein
VQLFASHHTAARLYLGMRDGDALSALARRTRCVEPDPILSFVDTGGLEPHPRRLVERLLYARALIDGNRVLAPRFLLGICAAEHHIVLGGARTGVIAADRLMSYGFAVEAGREPTGLRFFISSAHAEPEIRALLVAITIVVRELAALDDDVLRAEARRRAFERW